MVNWLWRRTARISSKPCIIDPMHFYSWWRHQIETFSALLALCAGNSPVTGEFPAQRPVTRSFDVFFDVRLNQQLSKQLRRRWFETPSRSLWPHCNGSGKCTAWTIDCEGVQQGYHISLALLTLCTFTGLGSIQQRVENGVIALD